ncbi:MAG: HAD-IIIA family hydrolase [Bacteroidales bacterium]|nr:HAD-IIIA family hydrolase [Bacteroidales bacterium]
MSIESHFGRQITPQWTLFLDRDGVINQRIIGDYVKKQEEFVLLERVKEAIDILSGIFGLIIVVTNQQGIGKGLMTEKDLENVHQYMQQLLDYKVNKIYYAPALASENSVLRKPNIGMALQAQKDFPQIDFSRSIMVGDSVSDMLFGVNAGMKTVFLSSKNDIELTPDLQLPDLYTFAHILNQK